MNKKVITLEKGKSIYFASDFHLGAPDYNSSRAREEKIVKWLEEIKDSAQEVFILGDVFDFWFEYKYLAPKGFVRFLGKIAELADGGIPVSFFKGNHDMWMKAYLEKEIGVKIYDNTFDLSINGFEMQIGHGDGLGPGDHTYKFLRKIFRSGWAKWLFTRLHPNFSFWIATTWSGHSRLHNDEDKEHLGAKEFLYQYCQQQQVFKRRDLYVFGHRHLPMEVDLDKEGKYVNLGEWINYFTYGVFDGNSFSLKKYEG